MAGGIGGGQDPTDEKEERRRKKKRKKEGFSGKESMKRKIPKN